MMVEHRYVVVSQIILTELACRPSGVNKYGHVVVHPFTRKSDKNRPSNSRYESLAQEPSHPVQGVFVADFNQVRFSSRIILETVPNQGGR